MSSSEKVTVDDCIVLGNAVPDEISDHRFTVCTAAYSEKLGGLIRIYPVPPGADMKRWNIVRVPLERDTRDNRRESWKVQGSKAEWNTLHRKMTVVKKISKREEQQKLIVTLQSSFGVECIDVLNDRKLSLGFVSPKVMGYEFAERAKFEGEKQLSLFSDEPFLTINNYDVQPRIKYRCSGCTAKNPHNQQVIEWGVYEWMRKNPTNKEEVWKILGLSDPSIKIAGFLVGNQFLYRNSFMVISVFRFKAA